MCGAVTPAQTSGATACHELEPATEPMSPMKSHTESAVRLTCRAGARVSAAGLGAGADVVHSAHLPVDVGVYPARRRGVDSAVTKEDQENAERGDERHLIDVTCVTYVTKRRCTRDIRWVDEPLRTLHAPRTLMRQRKTPTAEKARKRRGWASRVAR